ncbi:2861_t:CDS:2 [Entrophospora sp. SA101]|nr:2861_t:CDS:2 [Entrophospora sp. SA101]
MSRSYEHEKVAWDLFCQGMEAISLLPEEPVVNYENYDDLPDAVELFSKAFEMLESMKSGSYLQQK